MYIVVDVATDSVIIASKLTCIADFVNREARCPAEIVSVCGLWQAADKMRLHKRRYIVSRCDISESEAVFEKAREGFKRATLIT